jgi:hypothetical protein
MTVDKSSKARNDITVPLTAKAERADPMRLFIAVELWFLRIKSPDFMKHAFLNMANGCIRFQNPDRLPKVERLYYKTCFDKSTGIYNLEHPGHCDMKL